MCYVYIITNSINNKQYIGKTTKTIEERFASHRHDSKFSKTVLYKAFKKYGIDNFIISVIEECDSDKLNEREIYWIQKYNSIVPNGYNLTIGGTGGDTSMSENFKESVIRRKRDGYNNGRRGKFGVNNPCFGKTFQRRSENVTEIYKKSWENIERKENAAKRFMGERNPMFGKSPPNSKKIKVDSVVYDSIAAASKTLGISVYTVRKIGEIIE